MIECRMLGSLVGKAGKTYHHGDFCEGLFEFPGGRQAVHGVGPVEHHCADPSGRHAVPERLYSEAGAVWPRETALEKSRSCLLPADRVHRRLAATAVSTAFGSGNAIPSASARGRRAQEKCCARALNTFAFTPVLSSTTWGVKAETFSGIPAPFSSVLPSAQVVEQAEGYVALAAEGHRYPVVRIGRGHRKPGTDMDEQILLILLWLVKGSELPGKLDVGDPGLKEIRAEGNQKIGLIDTIARYRAAPKTTWFACLSGS